MDLGNSTPATSVDNRPLWANDGIGRVAAPLRDQVLSLVRQAIFDFELRPGQRLIERELVEQLQVSRTTVRDVLARLAAEGLVTVIPQKGAIVSVPSPSSAADIYEMRSPLEALAVTRFIERATPAQVAQLREAFNEFAEVSVADDEHAISTRLRSKDRIYEVLLDGANSPPLASTLTSLQGQVRVLRATSLSVPGRSHEAVEEMRAVIEAIEAGDVEKASAACALHVRNAGRIALAKLAGFDDQFALVGQ